MRGLLIFGLLIVAISISACSKPSITGNVVGNTQQREQPNESRPSIAELEGQRLHIMNELDGISEQLKSLDIEYWRKDTLEERRASIKLILDQLNDEEYRLEQELQKLDARILEMRIE